LVATGNSRDLDSDMERRLGACAAETHGHDFVFVIDDLNFFRYGCPPHGGMGVGVARLLMLMLRRPLPFGVRRKRYRNPQADWPKAQPARRASACYVETIESRSRSRE
jgi:tRNA synthetases class II (D, K and N)